MSIYRQNDWQVNMLQAFSYNKVYYLLMINVYLKWIVKRL